MRKLHQWGGTPPRKSQRLRKTVRRMKNCGCTNWAILHEIRTSDCSKEEQDRLLKELHMEVHVL